MLWAWGHPPDPLDLVRHFTQQPRGFGLKTLVLDQVIGIAPFAMAMAMSKTRSLVKARSSAAVSLGP